MSTLYFKNVFSPGDLVVFTAFLRDLATVYPEEYTIYVNTRCPQLFLGNPYVIHHASAPKNATIIDVNYVSQIPRRINTKRHFITAYYTLLNKKLNLDVPVLKPHGDLHLNQFMAQNRPVDDKYWVAFCGGKVDWHCKLWFPDRWQKTINLLSDQGINVVHSGHAANKVHIQPKLESSLNLVGWGGLTEMMWLIYHAEGVISYVSAPMHIAAAFQKPCVVIAGGKEPVAWEAYTNDNLEAKFGPKCEPLTVEHKFLDTFGQLPCCSGKNACYARDLEGPDKRRLCKNVLIKNGQKMPACMDLITPEMVVDAVLSYNQINIKGPNMPNNQEFTRIVAITPLMMLELDKKPSFRKALPHLHKAIAEAQKFQKRCCRSTKEVLSYNVAWNDIKKKVLELGQEQQERLKRLAKVKELIINYKDEADKSKRAVI